MKAVLPSWIHRRGQVWSSSFESIFDPFEIIFRSKLLKVLTLNVDATPSDTSKWHAYIHPSTPRCIHEFFIPPFSQFYPHSSEKKSIVARSHTHPLFDFIFPTLFSFYANSFSLFQQNQKICPLRFESDRGRRRQELFSNDQFSVSLLSRNKKSCILHQGRHGKSQPQTMGPSGCFQCLLWTDENGDANGTATYAMNSYAFGEIEYVTWSSMELSAVSIIFLCRFTVRNSWELIRLSLWLELDKRPAKLMKSRTQQVTNRNRKSFYRIGTVNKRTCSIDVLVW